MLQISLISSTAGVNFRSRHSTDSIYKNASTGPVVSQRCMLHLVKKKGPGQKKKSRRWFLELFSGGPSSHFDQFSGSKTTQIVTGFTAPLGGLVDAVAGPVALSRTVWVRS